MNKETFIWILQSSLLSWEGVEEKDLVNIYGINSYIAETGVKLTTYLKGFDFLDTRRSGK